MTRPTREQLKAMSTQRYEYGHETSLSIEDSSDWPHGLLRMHWRPEAMPNEKPRDIFIRPDGTELRFVTVAEEVTT